MIRFLKELYLTGFTIGFRLRMPEKLGGGWGPIVDAGKGVGLVWLIEFFILKGIESYIEIHFGTKFYFLDSTQWTNAIVITLALYLPNYYILVARRHGIKFEREEFKNLKKSRKFFLIASFVAMLLATAAFSIYSDSAYRRFLHIVPNQ
jgi:hypothetical protein